MTVGSIEFLDAFIRALKAVASGTPDWQSATDRTHVLLGAAGRKGRHQDRAASVLHRTFRDLRYQFGDHDKNERVFAYEWLHKDVVAVEGAESWARACWRGRYLTQIVCEVENSIAEFEMTMRGMLDVRAMLYVGIFFGKTDDPLVGEAHWNRECREPTRPLSAWSPPIPGKDFPWSLAQGEEVLTIVLSEAQPTILAARKHVFQNGIWKGATSLDVNRP